MEKIKNISSDEYYIGLDIGTDSVGYAVTDTSYALQKFKNEPMWGVTTFDEAKGSEERRGFRTARRRLDRRQWRLRLLSEIFAEEIAKTDERFFIRLKESGLYRDDVSSSSDRHIYFNDDGYNDSEYFREYPTIHHLIDELVNSKAPHDIRLVYLAIAWLVAHRGHFLSEISKENVNVVSDFSKIYDSFMDFFQQNGYEKPWECSAEDFLRILQMKAGISAKEKEFSKVLFGGKMPKDKVIAGDEELLQIRPFNRALLIKLLCGGKAAPKEIFLACADEYSELSSFSLKISDEEFLALTAQLNDNAEIIIKLKELYDAVTLIELLDGEERISKAKIKVYEQHKADLKNLKYLVRKYVPSKYNEVFRIIKKGTANYVAYSGNVKSVKDKKSIAELKDKSKKEDFCKYINNLLKNVVPEEKDVPVFNDIKFRLENCTFMPKQVNSDNRLIPYQLYYVELREVLENAKAYCPFLNKVDENGISEAEKIISIFEFRVPYFTGPVHKNEKNGANSWIIRRPGRIFPWNFNEKVDLDASEQEFIRRLINRCTYLPSEDVLPKDSLLYSEFCVLNEINNIKIDDREISVELKKKIYNELFMKKSRVTVKAIRDFCISQGEMNKNSVLSGIDITVKASLKSHIDFRCLMESGKLTYEDAEKIIERSAYSDNKYRLRKWLKNNYSVLSEDDIRYIASRNYKDFGRLSRRFLSGFYGAMAGGDGEAFTIIAGMRETNNNMMQLLSDKYSFSQAVEEEIRDYYTKNPRTLSERLDEMYVSNAVKRPIMRTLDIVSEIVKVKGAAPSRIFVEMARGAAPEHKNKRTIPRKDNLYKLYSSIKDEDMCALKEQLESMGENADNKLQSERLYLYYLQLGKCMYSGEAIDLDKLMNDKVYDVDHIYPQSVVKDDSFSNKVLVLSKINGEKGDKYPVSSDIQTKMSGYWKKLYDNKLITEEKYKRLTRTHGFSDDEKMGFINRQIVETRQSTKAVASILKEKYPMSEIVYVKAGLVSDFRHEYSLLKSRTVNDLHHAKDAYLNIVVGNVYHNKFSKKWFKLTDKYNMKTEKIFEYPVNTSTGETVWTGKENIAAVKKNYLKNHVHITRYAFTRRGGLFDQMPLKAASGLVPRKKDLPAEKYGGYNKPTASFFSLVKYSDGKKTDIMVMPVDLMNADKFIADEVFRKEYAANTIRSVRSKNVCEVDFPLGSRILKINTVFELDGMRVCLAGKDSGGVKLLISNLMPFVCDNETEEYIRKTEKLSEKIKNNPSIKYDAMFSDISKEENEHLYELYINKLEAFPYNKRPVNPVETLKKGREKFMSMDILDQVACLNNIQMLFGRYYGGVDLSAVGGAPNACKTTLSSNISNWKKVYEKAYIIDVSASGLYEKRSVNLLDLL